jgi:tetratricopeptide (TPR) repeat protein
VGAALLLALLLAAGSWAWWRQRGQAARRRQTEREVAEALAEALALNRQGWEQMDDPDRWQATAGLARSAVRRAQRLLATGVATDDLADRVRAAGVAAEEGARASALRAELDRIRLGQAAAVKEGHFHREAAVPLYAKALGGYGIDPASPEAAAERVRSSALRRALLSALEDWARFTPNPAERLRLEGVLRRAEPAPDAFRGRWRAALARRDGGGLARLARRPNAQGLPASALVTMAEDLKRVGELATAEQLLRAGQERFPNDFWVNHQLGMVLLDRQKAEEAVGFLRVALALHPRSAGVYLNLGSALRQKGDVEGAVRCYRTAVATSPDYAEAHCDLGLALWKKGHLDEAIAEYRTAIRLNKDDALAHIGLGNALAAKGRLDEAIAEHRTAIRLKRGSAEAHHDLGLALKAKGRLDEAIAAYREALRLRKDFPEAYCSLGALLCDRRKDYDGAIAAFREALRLNQGYAEAHYNLGNALAAKGRLDEAVAEYREALRLKKDFAMAHVNLGALLCDHKKDYDGAIAAFQAAIRIRKDIATAHFNLGIALKAKGRLEEAIAAYREAIRLKKDVPEAHCNLGNALHARRKLAEAEAAYRRAIWLRPGYAEAHRGLGIALLEQGRFADALAFLRRGHELASKNPRWPHPSAQWVRQAEWLAKLDAKLPAVLRGEAEAVGADECVGLASICRQHRQLYAASARLYGEAFAARPVLADQPDAGHRYNAACAAALAGRGRGEDAGGLGQPERARLRGQALDWLRADLEAWRRRLGKEPGKARPIVLKQMRHWLHDADLAAVRGPEALARLPEAERAGWQKLWEGVAALEKRAAGPD